jgi:putative transposase
MPRRSRNSAGGYIYHVANWSESGEPVFPSAFEYRQFESILGEMQERVNIRLLAYCLLPDRWQLLLWPRKDGDLSEFMRLLCVTQVQRLRSSQGTVGVGRLYKSRFKSFPVQNGTPLLSVCRYVEALALRAKKTRKAENWKWCSLWRRLHGSGDIALAQWPVARPKNWTALLNRPFDVNELAALDHSLLRDTPYGDPRWQKATAARLGLESTMRPRGRPRKSTKR